MCICINYKFDINESNLYFIINTHVPFENTHLFFIIKIIVDFQMGIFKWGFHKKKWGFHKKKWGLFVNTNVYFQNHNFVYLIRL